MGMIRFNFLHPPFNNQKMRQALLYVVDQNDYVLGIAGDPKNGRTCYSFFTCGTPLSSEVGAEPMKGKRDFDKAKQLIKEAGLQGREDRDHRRHGPADRALAVAAHRRACCASSASTSRCRRATGAR